MVNDVLKYEIRPADDSSAESPLIILMHGRGATRHDLLGLADAMPAHANVVFPEAPFPGAPWGYGPGSAWYQFLGTTKPEPESYARSLDELGKLIESFNASKVVVGGFSQGGTVALGYALAHPGEVDGVLNFSGFLADHPRVVISKEAVGDTPIFWGHGVSDTSITFDRAREGRAQLKAVGANLTEKTYNIGHWIEPEELQDAVAWLQTFL